MNRRTLLATLGTTVSGSLAGCRTITDEAPPAGSLRFTNQDSLPHTIQLSVTDVGSELNADTGTLTGTVTVPAPQRNLTATEQLSPETSTEYTDVFTDPVWYEIECTVDHRQTADREVMAQALFHPAPPERTYVNYLHALLRDSGRIELAVITTENTGRYTPAAPE